MIEREVKVALAAILTTALETEPASFPESMAYIALECDMHKWEMVKAILLKANFATFAGSQIKLTDAGRKCAVELNEKLKGKVV